MFLKYINKLFIILLMAGTVSMMYAVYPYRLYKAPVLEEEITESFSGICIAGHNCPH